MMMMVIVQVLMETKEKVSKMGKAMARELKEVRIDFVSFVDQGANGAKFEIFKSAKAKEEKSTEPTEGFTKEQESLFKKFLDFFKRETEDLEENKTEVVNKEIGGDMDLDKIVKMMEKLEATVKSIDARLTLSEEAAGEGEVPKPEGEVDESTGTEGTTDPPEDPKPEEGTGDQTPKEPAGAGEEGADAEVEKANKIVMDSLERMSKSIEGISKRIDNVEKIRKDSKGAGGDADTDNIEKSSVFAGAF